MRLDKFLKVSRLFKRRTVAQDVLREGLVTVNGRLAKPATRVKPGDIVVVSLGGHTVKLEVRELNERVTAKEAPRLYRLLEG